MIIDPSDDELRRSLVLKWGSVDADVIPAWVAEMDYRTAPEVSGAVAEAVARGELGYPSFDPERLGQAYAGFARRHYDQQVDAAQVLPVVDVTAGLRLALDVLSDPGPVVLPTPAHHPHFRLVTLTGRELWELPVGPDEARGSVDVDRLDALFAGGARTLLLTQPHNPLGHVHTRAELEAIRDVVVRHGGRVVSDEVHAPLVLPGASHVPYLSLDGTGDHAVAVVAAGKAFNTAGLRCAQVVTDDPATHDRLLEGSLARNESWSGLGEVAAVAAYTHGDAWLAALLERLDDQRTLLAHLLDEHLPLARMRPLEATYLVWLDLRAYGADDPAGLALDKGRVRLVPGHLFQHDLVGHLRLNLATSPARLTEIVRRLASALA